MRKKLKNLLSDYLRGEVRHGAGSLSFHFGYPGRAVPDLVRYMAGKTNGMIGLLVTCLLFAWRAIAGQGQENREAPPEHTSPSGIFESVDTWHPGGPFTNRTPVFTLRLETNRTYTLNCSRPDYERSIDGDVGLFAYCHFGVAHGIWQWSELRGEIVLVCTNDNGHIRYPVPRVLRFEEHHPDRLEDVSSPPRMPFSPFFNRQKK